RRPGRGRAAGGLDPLAAGSRRRQLRLGQRPAGAGGAGGRREDRPRPRALAERPRGSVHRGRARPLHDLARGGGEGALSAGARRWTGLLLTGLLLAAAGWETQEAPPGALPADRGGLGGPRPLPIPEPDTAGMESAVREQIEAQRLVLARVAANPRTPP